MKNTSQNTIVNSNSTPEPNSTLLTYLKSQKKWLIQAVILSVVGYILLKFCFPYPDFDLDSTNYVAWAYNNMAVAYRPMGYSHFLIKVHNVFDSLQVVVTIQYLLFFLSTLFAFFSIDYFLGIPGKLKQVLIVLAFVNPILMFQANFISSDSLFCSLTVALVILSIWLAKTGDWKWFLLLLVVLYYCFALRLASLFYPVIPLAALVIGRMKTPMKLIFTGAIAILVFMFVQDQKNTNEKEMGTPIFSAFSGWQMANNALYCYNHIKIDPSDLPTDETRVIDSMAKKYVDSVQIPNEIGCEYLWDPKSPCKHYCYYRMMHDRESYFKTWYAVSPDLNDYGWYVARKYPGAFIRYFMFPNFKHFFYPVIATLKNYNLSELDVTPEVNQWFNYDIKKLSCRYPTLQQSVMAGYPLFSGLFNVFNIITIIAFMAVAIPARKKIRPILWTVSLIWSLFYFSFMGFNIFAADVYLRFLDPIFCVGFLFSCVLWKEAIAIRNARRTENMQ